MKPRFITCNPNNYEYKRFIKYISENMYKLDFCSNSVVIKINNIPIYNVHHHTFNNYYGGVSDQSPVIVYLPNDNYNWIQLNYIDTKRIRNYINGLSDKF